MKCVLAPADKAVNNFIKELDTTWISGDSLHAWL